MHYVIQCYSLLLMPVKLSSTFCDGNFFVIPIRCTTGVEGVVLQADTVGLSNLSFKGNIPNYEEIKL